MSSIGKAIGPLVNIALLLLFAVIIFAIIGLEFYAGALNRTCYNIENLSKDSILKLVYIKTQMEVYIYAKLQRSEAWVTSITLLSSLYIWCHYN